MGRGEIKRDSKKDELRLSFWDDTLITHMDFIYDWIAFSGEWAKCHFSIIQTFILLFMPQIWKPFLLFLSLFIPTDVLWTADEFSSSSRSSSMADKECTSHCSCCHWAQKDRSRPQLNHSLPFLLLCLGQYLLFSPSPWPVSWHLPFFWFSRHMLPHLSLSRQDLV